MDKVFFSIGIKLKINKNIKKKKRQFTQIPYTPYDEIEDWIQTNHMKLIDI